MSEMKVFSNPPKMKHNSWEVKHFLFIDLIERGEKNFEFRVHLLLFLLVVDSTRKGNLIANFIIAHQVQLYFHSQHVQMLLQTSMSCRARL